MRRFLWLTLLILIAAAPVLAAEQPAPAPSQKQVTLDFQGLALEHALSLWANASGVKYATIPADLGNRPITLAFGRPLPLGEALQQIATAADLAYTRVGDTYVFAQKCEPPSHEPRVTIDTKGASFGEVFRLLFRGTRYSFTLEPGLESRPAPAISLNDVPLSAALEAISQLANLKITRENDIFVVRTRPTITIEGQQVPMLGTIGIGGGEGPVHRDGGAGSSGVPVSAETLADLARQAARASLADAGIAPLPMAGEPIIDLVVTNVPFREAVAQIVKASHLDIVVHPAVPQSIRVTAKMFQVPAIWLLRSLAGQAHLVVQTTEVREPVGGEMKSHWRYTVTPQPELSVTGVPETKIPRQAGPWPPDVGAGGLKYLGPGNEVLRGQVTTPTPAPAPPAR